MSPEVTVGIRGHPWARVGPRGTCEPSRPPRTPAPGSPGGSPPPAAPVGPLIPATRRCRLLAADRARGGGSGEARPAAPPPPRRATRRPCHTPPRRPLTRGAAASRAFVQRDRSGRTGRAPVVPTRPPTPSPTRSLVPALPFFVPLLPRPDPPRHRASLPVPPSRPFLPSLPAGPLVATPPSPPALHAHRPARPPARPPTADSATAGARGDGRPAGSSWGATHPPAACPRPNPLRTPFHRARRASGAGALGCSPCACLGRSPTPCRPLAIGAPVLSPTRRHPLRVRAGVAPAPRRPPPPAWQRDPISRTNRSVAWVGRRHEPRPPPFALVSLTRHPSFSLSPGTLWWLFFRPCPPRASPARSRVVVPTRTRRVLPPVHASFGGIAVSFFLFPPPDPKVRPDTGAGVCEAAGACVGACARVAYLVQLTLDPPDRPVYGIGRAEDEGGEDGRRGVEGGCGARAQARRPTAPGGASRGGRRVRLDSPPARRLGALPAGVRSAGAVASPCGGRLALPPPLSLPASPIPLSGAAPARCVAVCSRPSFFFYLFFLRRLALSLTLPPPPPRSPPASAWRHHGRHCLPRCVRRQ